MGCWPMVIGCILRTAGSFIIWNYADPLTSLELPNCYLTLALFRTETEEEDEEKTLADDDDDDDAPEVRGVPFIVSNLRTIGLIW